MRAEVDALAEALRRVREGALEEVAVTRQETTAARMRRAGWCLGVLAAARGVDLLRERSESEGLRWMVSALAEACSFELARPAAELPLIAARSAREAWELSLLAGWCLLQVGARPGDAVRWSAGEGNERSWLAFEAPSSSAELETRCSCLAASLPISPCFEDGRLVLAWG